MIRYRIRVEEGGEEEINTNSWERVADTGNPKDGGAMYAYVPTVERHEVEVSLYEQTVPTLDLAAVIRAVNGMKETP